jgi:hypothetical protein
MSRAYGHPCHIQSPSPHIGAMSHRCLDSYTVFKYTMTYLKALNIIVVIVGCTRNNTMIIVLIILPLFNSLCSLSFSCSRSSLSMAAFIILEESYGVISYVLINIYYGRLVEEFSIMFSFLSLLLSMRISAAASLP